MYMHYENAKLFLEDELFETIREMESLEPIPKEMLCAVKELTDSIKNIMEIIMLECLVKDELMYYHSHKHGMAFRHDDEDEIEQHVVHHHTILRDDGFELDEIDDIMDEEVE